MDRLTPKVAARHKTAILARDFQALLSHIAATGKHLVAMQKQLPSKWKHDLAAYYKTVLLEGKYAHANEELLKDAKSMYDAAVKAVDELAREWSYDAAKRLLHVASMHSHQDKGYWDPEWIADGQDIEHPLQPLMAGVYNAYSDFQALMTSTMDPYTPGAIHRSLYAITPNDLHKEVKEIVTTFFNAFVHGNVVQAFRDFWLALKKLAEKAQGSTAEKGMSVMDACYELKKHAEHAHDKWAEEFADSLARHLMRGKPTPKQLQTLKQKLDQYGVGPVRWDVMKSY